MRIMGWNRGFKAWLQGQQQRGAKFIVSSKNLSIAASAVTVNNYIVID